MANPNVTQMINMIHTDRDNWNIKYKQTIIDKIGKNGTHGTLNSPGFGCPYSFLNFRIPAAIITNTINVTILVIAANWPNGTTPAGIEENIPTTIVAL